MTKPLDRPARKKPGSRGGWGERDGVAEVGGPADEPPGLDLPGAPVEVAGAEVPVGGAVLEHVVGRGQDRGGDGAHRLLRAAAGAQAVAPGLEVARLLAAGRPGALDEGGLQPGRALAQAGGAALAGAPVVPRARPGPGDEVAGGREAAHVGADLGDDDPGRERADAGDRGRRVARGAKGGEPLLHLPIDPL